MYYNNYLSTPILLPEFELLFNETLESDITVKHLKQYILVAGVNYENLRHKLKSYCENRMERWKRINSSKSDLRFIIFDTEGGTIETYDITYPAGKQMVSKKTDNKFTPVTAASYIRVEKDHAFGFKNGQTGVMSILDIYAAVQEIGKTNTGSLIELSFFSHGWMGGPILVNSCDRYDSNSGCFITAKLQRDPDDKDPRTRKDFTTANMSTASQQHFKNAFHVNGFTWLWGCTFTKSYFWGLHKLINKYGLTLANEKKISLVYSADEINLIRKCNTTGNCSLKSVTFNTTFKPFKEYICEGINNTYASAIAQASGKKTYAALLGTYAVYESSSSTLNPLMKVEGFQLIKNFYKKYFSMDLDPAGLGYGTYAPYPVC